VLVRNAGKLVSQRQLLQEPDPAKPRDFITEARMGYRFEPEGPGQH
jgi:hypothetical protein